jgi:N-acetylmuramoyl-L-alanine amidase
MLNPVCQQNVSPATPVQRPPLPAGNGGRDPRVRRSRSALPPAHWLSFWLFLLGGCTGMAGFKVRTVELAGVTYVLARDIAGYYDLKYSRDDNKVFLRSKGHDLSFTIDRREFRVGGVTANLSFAPILWSGAAAFSEADFRLLLDPILRPQALPRRRVNRIVLDPGHGGKDQGAATRNVLEKQLCLALAQKTAAALRRLGYDVQLTRSTDRALTLEQRGIILERLEADLFISLHANFAADRSVKGIETFLLTPRGTASTYSKTVSKVRKRGNQFDRTNTRLAYDLHRNLLASTGAEDRGVKHANFQVLREASCPAVLLEIGFISNASEERNLLSATYQDRLVAGLVAGVRAFQRNLGSGR